MKANSGPTLAGITLYLAAQFCPLLLLVSGCKQSNPAVSFGKAVVAAQVDSNNAPTALADSFSTNQKTIYFVVEAKSVAAGSHLRAKWMKDGTVIQESNEVVAAQPYNNTNIEFHMDPGASGWLPGNYTVQILADDKPGPEAGFTIK